ncbi:hypothetical protein L6164_017306 [Bauhinia variegata]|uniref:Uncharacterized protein n=1 Tax=Bauhinia variegata TaxID=167791 RepID=A0ACB9N7H2_BAUVA|nr:hypothetical protein L6164_017306 [Bauhinia variegata]
MVLPIFFHVEPSEVRHQKGPFAEAFAKQKDAKRHSEERIQRWRTALEKAADLSGLPLGDGTEASLIERIVGEIWNMGREIVRKESPNDPGQRSRLWFHEDILQVLKENTGSNKVEAIKLTLSEPEEVQLTLKSFTKMKRLEPEEVQLTPKSFKKMKRLRILIIHNAQCYGDHLEYLSNELSWLKLCQPVSSFKDFKRLKHVNLRDSKFITKVPDLSGCHNLEYLVLRGCLRLKEFSEFVDNMDCLRIIQLDRTGIEALPSSIERITGLEHLNMSDCQNLTNIPSCIYKLQKLQELRLDNCTKLGKFPVFSNKRQKFTSLNEGSSNIESISSLNLFPSLCQLDLANCNLSEVNFLTDIEHFLALETLVLDENNITMIPACLHKFAKLNYLSVSDCKLLQEIPQPPPNIAEIDAYGCESLQRFSQLISTHGDQLTSIRRPEDFKCLTRMELIDCESITEVPNLLSFHNLTYLNFAGCSKLKKFPKIIDNMDCLQEICLDRTGIEELPSSIERITGLQRLYMSSCQNLTNLPSSIYKLQKLVVLLLDNCSKLGKFPVFSNKKQKFTSLNEGSSNTESISSLNLFLSLRTLDLQNCNLSEVNFLTDIEHFPALSKLYLNENNITTIPACLHKLAKLSYLNMSNCKLLQEIPKLPADMGEIDAYGCESLQIYSQFESMPRGGTHGDQVMSMLREAYDLIQGELGFSGKPKLEILIPGSEIPGWFSHQRLESFISF